MTISKVDAQALATFIGRCRPDWDHPGIVAAIGKAAHLGSPAAIGAALCRLAENYELRTPATLVDPGKHWHGTSVATRQPPVMCPDHPGEKAGACPKCEAAAVPPPPDWRDGITLARRARPHTKPEPTNDLEATRARADAQEAQQ